MPHYVPPTIPPTQNIPHYVPPKISPHRIGLTMYHVPPKIPPTQNMPHYIPPQIPPTQNVPHYVLSKIPSTQNMPHYVPPKIPPTPVNTKEMPKMQYSKAVWLLWSQFTMVTNCLCWLLWGQFTMVSNCLCSVHAHAFWMRQDCGPLSKAGTPVHRSRSRVGLLSDSAGDWAVVGNGCWWFWQGWWLGSSMKGVLAILTGLVTGQ